MAEISLRAYIDYIGDRLDRDAYSEVVAQCRHILETYPKHIDTYKQLARALAAQGNFTDALDLFQRVLSSDPTDFIAHIGMSECYKEDGALEQAIWHLERAFEQVPGNSDLQEALKQLYEQRDRKAPRKIQMSGGALARMYIRGKLYPQAISELTKAIAHDPERLDLQVLMADALWHAHQHVAAGKVAAEILKKIPYSVAANRILAQLWFHAGQPKEARPFLERVKELDPYLGYELEHGQAAPPDAFHIVMLDFAATQVTGRVEVADWVADIDGIEKKRDVTGPLQAPIEPAAGAFAPPPSAVSRGPAPEAAAPDWLQEALGATGSTPAGAAATPGSLAGVEPDWLKDALGGPGGAPLQPGEAPTGDAPDWLRDAMGSPTPTQPSAPMPGPSEGAPDWLNDVLGSGAATPPPAPMPPVPAPAGDAPDWLQDALSQETPVQPPPMPPGAPAPAGGAPEWLQDVLSQETPAQPSPVLPGTPAPASDAPEWLKDALEKEQPPQTPAPSIPEEAAPAWLEEAAAQETPLQPPSPAPAEPTPPENAPEWLAKVLSERTPPSLEPVPADWGQPAGDEPRSAPDWLNDLAAAETQPPSASPAAPSVVSEEWLDEFITGGAAPAPEEQPAISSELATGPVSLDALGDLETWDASEEAAEEIPSSPPEGWLMQDTGLEPPKAKEPEEEAQALPDWLATGAALLTNDNDIEPEGAEPEASAEKEMPDWLKVEPAMPAEAAPVLEEEIHVAPDDELRDGDTSPDDTPDWLASGDLDSDDALKWLEEIAARVDPNFKPSGTTEEAAPVAAAPEPVKAEAEEELPDWLNAPVAAAPEPAKAEEEEEEEEALPDWLKGEAAPVAAAPEPAEAEEEKEEALPDWLKGEAAPVAAAPEPAKAEEEEEALPDWLKGEAAPVAAVPEPAEAEEEEEELEWLRKPTEEPAARVEAEEEGLPDWLRGEEKEAPKAAAASEPSGALAWLDEQTAGQGVSADQVVSEALTPDHPPVAASMVPDEEAEAKRVTTGELPSWLVGARDEMSKALESPVGEPEMAEDMAELPEMPVEADELAWLNETLKAEEQAAGIDLEEILGEKPAAADAEAKAEEEEEKEELPEWLSKPETAPVGEAKEEAEELPGWLTKSEAAPAAEEELPEWLAKSEAAPAAEGKEEELPEWLAKSEAAPAAEAREEAEELPEWIKGPEPVPAAKAEEEEVPPWLKKAEPVPAAEEKEAVGEELPDWLEKPEEVPVIEAKEGAEELPDWLTKTEVEAAPAPEPVAAPSVEIKEEEGKLPDWLAAPEPAAVESDLADFLKAVEPAPAPAAEAQPAPVPEPTAPTAVTPPPPAAAPAPVPAAPPPAVTIPAGEAAAQLQAAREQISAGELQAALAIYEGLAASGQHLDETVADLSEVVKSRVVVNPRVYRVMGDAMMGQGRMQEALDMYRKALDQF